MTVGCTWGHPLVPRYLGLVALQLLPYLFIDYIYSSFVYLGVLAVTTVYLGSKRQDIPNVSATDASFLTPWTWRISVRLLLRTAGTVRKILREHLILDGDSIPLPFIIEHDNFVQDESTLQCYIQQGSRWLARY